VPRYDPEYVHFVQRKQLARMNLKHFRSFLRESLGSRGAGQRSE
jgi:hypothetical protein